MNATPVEEHAWLRQLVGDWTYEAECVTAPGEAPMKFTGSESVRALGELWVICEGRGEMPGGSEGFTVMTLGYDPAKACFVGTFIGSMMTHLWLYEGALDVERRLLTLNTEGACPTPTEGASAGQMTEFKDIIELKGHDQRTLTSVMRGEDGEWREIMKATYRRRT